MSNHKLLVFLIKSDQLMLVRVYTYLYVCVRLIGLHDTHVCTCMLHIQVHVFTAVLKYLWPNVMGHLTPSYQLFMHVPVFNAFITCRMNVVRVVSMGLHLPQAGKYIYTVYVISN